jgi:hypothetical protein
MGVFWRRVLDFVVPIKFSMGFQHAPNSLLILSHILCPKFDSCTDITIPKEEITTYLYGDSPKLEYYYHYEPINDVHRKRKEKWTFEVTMNS